jgi:hypothetical protein
VASGFYLTPVEMVMLLVIIILTSMDLFISTWRKEEGFLTSKNVLIWNYDEEII